MVTDWARVNNQAGTAILLVKAGADPTLQPGVAVRAGVSLDGEETGATKLAVDVAIAEATLDSVLAWWPLMQRGRARQMLAAQARDRGLRDEALLPGTKLRVNTIGDGIYSGFERSRIGTNDHYIRFGEVVRKVELKKLGPSEWSVL